MSADCCMREVEEDGALNGGRGIIKKGEKREHTTKGKRKRSNQGRREERKE